MSGRDGSFSMSATIPATDGYMVEMMSKLVRGCVVDAKSVL